MYDYLFIYLSIYVITKNGIKNELQKLLKIMKFNFKFKRNLFNQNWKLKLNWDCEFWNFLKGKAI